MYYSDELIVERVKQLSGYKGIPKEYWIVGVRSSEDVADTFDDVFYLMYGGNIIQETTGTTNPGLRVLQGGFKKYTNKGAAILKSDEWYYDVWKYGLHKRYMPALLQVGSKVKVYRDKNCNKKSEESGLLEEGWFGINFHTATRKYLERIVKRFIGGWSAGCQVCNSTEEYNKIINTIRDSKQGSVTYCLLKEFSV